NQISTLSPKKRDLLLRQLTKENGTRSQTHLRLQRRETDFIRLSFAQQRLWFFTQLEPSNPAYHIPVAFRIKGTLNVTSFEQSLNEIGRRHEALRTTFSVVDGQPVQRIAQAPTFALPVIDLQRLPENERDAEAMRLAGEEVRRPFDLMQGPLFRTGLLRLS